MNNEAFMTGYLFKEAEMSDIHYMKALAAAGALAGGIGGAVRKPIEEEDTSRFENAALGVQKGVLTGLGAGTGGVAANRLLQRLGVESDKSPGTTLAGLAAGTALGGLGAYYMGDWANRNARKRKKELLGKEAFMLDYLVKRVESEKEANVLSTKARESISKKNFAVPSKAENTEEKAESGNYPIPDISHARNALARSSGKSVEGQVRSKVYSKYPSLKANAEKEANVLSKYMGAASGSNVKRLQELIAKTKSKRKGIVDETVPGILQTKDVKQLKPMDTDKAMSLGNTGDRLRKLETLLAKAQKSQSKSRLGLL